LEGKKEAPMSTLNVPNKTTALARNKKISEGVDKYFSKVKSLTIGGDAYTCGFRPIVNARIGRS
jgi:hypothetical protein